MFKIEGVLKLVFILASFIYLPMTQWKVVQIMIGIVVCFLGLFRQLGKPKLDRNYFKQVISKDFGTTLVYLFTLLLIDKPNFAFMFPLNIFFAIGLSQCVKRSKMRIFEIQYIQNVAKTIIQVVNEFKKGRCYSEFFLFFYSIIVIKYVGIFFPLMLFNYLRIKGSSNQLAYTTFITLRNDINNKLNTTRFKFLQSLKVVNNYFFQFLTGAAA